MDVLESEARALQSDRPQDVPEVVNYISAMNYGLDRLEKLPLSLRLIGEIHEKLLQRVRGDEKKPGEFRTSQNWISSSEADGLTNATFIPPPPHEMRESLDNLEKFFYDQKPIPTLMKVGLIHAQFETIHPFLDGNGRIGRLLITFLLCEQKVLKRPLLYLSYFFKRYRQEYYDRLQAIRDRGDWERWMKFFLKGVYEVAQQATDTARQIVSLRESHRQLLTTRLKRNASTGFNLLESLYLKPIITVEEVMKLTNLTFSSANALVKQFQTLGLLSEITGQKRNRVFSYDQYLDLFESSEIDS